MTHIINILKKNISVYLIFIFIIIFAIIYHYLGSDHFRMMNSSINWVEAFYFSTSMQTLLGNGDIVPKTQLAKIIVSIQALITIVITLYFSGIAF